MLPRWLFFNDNIVDIQRNSCLIFLPKGEYIYNGDQSSLFLIEPKSNLTINIKNTNYKNQDSNYNFQDFDIVSSFKKGERNITVNSPDIINGTVSGKFQTKDILKLVENSIGSIYTNYVPNDVDGDQYINFKFNIYSKIAAVFFKDLTLGKNTFIEGRIETDEKGFNLRFNSPEIKFEDYFANNINVSVNNNNP